MRWQEFLPLHFKKRAIQRLHGIKFISRFSSVAISPSLNPVQVGSTKLDLLKSGAVSDSSDSSLTVVQTSESDRPREINDQELLALAADKPVALIHQGLHQAELVFLNPKDEKDYRLNEP